MERRLTRLHLLMDICPVDMEVNLDRLGSVFGNLKKIVNEHLNTSQSSAIYKLYFEGKSFQEVADELHTTTANVSNLKKVSLDILRRIPDIEAWLVNSPSKSRAVRLSESTNMKLYERFGHCPTTKELVDIDVNDIFRAQCIGIRGLCEILDKLYQSHPTCKLILSANQELEIDPARLIHIHGSKEFCGYRLFALGYYSRKEFQKKSVRKDILDRTTFCELDKAAILFDKKIMMNKGGKKKCAR